MRDVYTVFHQQEPRGQYAKSLQILKLCTSTTNVQMLHTQKNTLKETFLHLLVPLSFFTSVLYTHRNI